MSHYSNLNYFAGVLVVPKQLTKSNRTSCLNSKKCKDSSKQIPHLDTLQPNKTLFQHTWKMFDQSWIDRTCANIGIPVMAFHNMWSMAQFDFRMYPYITHKLRPTERELIELIFDLVYDAVKYSKVCAVLLTHILKLLKSKQPHIRLFYIELND